MNGKEINIQWHQVKSQREAVLWYLKTEGTITAWEAMKHFNIMRLAAIIHNLRSEGYEIATIMEQSVNKFNHKVEYARYRYVEPIKEVKQGQLF